jgi:hypothetical protein
MEDYDKHYMALGLQPGATQEEVRAAYRSLAKLYHPDKDASLDAEMRYKEVRRAYDVLRKKVDAEPSKSSHSTAGARQTTSNHNFAARAKTKRTATSGTGWYSCDLGETDGFNLNVNLNDLVWEYCGGKEKVKGRIAFSFAGIPVILWQAIREVAGIGMFIRVLLYVAVMKIMFAAIEYDGYVTSSHEGGGVGILFGSRLIANMFIFLPLAGFAFFRYYFSGDPAPAAIWPNMKANLSGALLYSAVAGFLIHIFNPRFHYFSLFGSWYSVAGTVFCALFLLWAHPSIWLEQLKHQRR